MNLIEKYDYSYDTKLNNFEKYVRRQSLQRFLARYELFKLIKDVKGSIVECGVHYGGGLMAWAKLSAGFDIFGLDRKIIGFDTFDGFPELSKNDLESVEHSELKKGGFNSVAMIKEELRESIYEFDQNRFLNQFSKVELIEGDACETISKYIEDNKHLVVSLLFLDFDLYEPTLAALQNFVPRMPKGSIIAFDELNNEAWKGETIAALEYFNSFNSLEFKKFSFDTSITYFQL
jgi:hypothetical protein